jgi:hypothetical protein
VPRLLLHLALAMFEQDERRITWAAGDIVENRSALSRWNPKYKTALRGVHGEGGN